MLSFEADQFEGDSDFLQDATVAASNLVVSTLKNCDVAPLTYLLRKPRLLPEAHPVETHGTRMPPPNTLRATST